MGIEGSTPEGRPIVGVVQLSAYPAVEERSGYPWLLQIRIELKDTEENGLPTASEVETVNALQDELLSAVSARTTRLGVGHLTGDGLRVAISYLPEAQTAHAVLTSRIQEGAVREFDYRIVRDPDWETVAEWFPESDASEPL